MAQHDFVSKIRPESRGITQKPADIYVVEVHNCRKGRLGETSECF